MIFHEKNFIRIEDGEYIIGLNRDLIERAYAKMSNTVIKKKFLLGSSPPHSVHLEAVYISRQLTTCSDFENFTSSTGYLTDSERDGWGWVMEDGWKKKDSASWKRPFAGADDAVYAKQGGRLPVLQVSWNDAVEYCRWLSAQWGREVRLPTEHEWEVFALLSGAKSIDDIIAEADWEAAEVDFIGTLIDDRASDVQNEIGLVWEWTGDWYGGYPGGIQSKEYGHIYRVLRGGSCMSHPVQKAREFRLRKCPTARSPYYGFRIALHR